MMKKALDVLLVLILLVMPSLTSSGVLLRSSAQTPTPIIEQPTIRVCSILYVWYGFNTTSLKWTGGLGTSHWNQTGSLSSTIVKDTPYFGFYSSMAEIPEQLQLMQQAGLNCVIISWWGWGVTNFSKPSALNVLDEAINNATKQVFTDVSNLQNSTFQVGLMVDAFNTTDVNSTDYKQIYDYVWDNFYSPYSNHTLAWQGKPLLLWFNPLVPTSNSSFTVRVTGNNLNDISPGWFFWTSPPQYFDYYGGSDNPVCTCYVGDPGPPISKNGEVSITPSYDDYYLYLAGSRTGYMRVDYTLSQGLYQSEWSSLESLSKNNNNVHLVIIYSWNEYHEQSAIEPHKQYTNPSAQEFYLYDETQQQISSLLKNPTNDGIYNFMSASMLMLAVIAVLGCCAYGYRRLKR